MPRNWSRNRLAATSSLARRPRVYPTVQLTSSRKMNTSLNNNQTVQLKVLTPLHIGAGAEKNWQRGVDFIEADEQIYVLDQRLLLEELSEQAIRDYTNFLGGNRLRDVERLIIDNCDLDAISQEVFPYGGGALNNEIKTVVRNGMRRPYVPGSSIKGALISAIFHRLHYLFGPERYNRYINKDLLGDMAQSIMHYVRPFDTGALSTIVTNVSLFNLYPEGTDWISDYKDDFKISIEHFKPGSISNFRMGIADGLGKIVEQMEKELRKALLPKYYKEIIKDQPHHALFSLINQYTHEHLRRELVFFKRYDQAPDTDLIIEELEKLQAQTQSGYGETCLLRMAAGSGFHGITGDWRFKNHLHTLTQPDEENKTWSQTQRARVPARYKSRKVMANGDELLLGFVELRLI